MQSEDNEENTIDVKQHNDISDKNSYSDWRHPLNIKYTDFMYYDPDFRKRRKMRYSRYISMHAKNPARFKRLGELYHQPVDCACKSQLSFSDSENSVSSCTNTVFHKREITTIPEEVFHYKRQSKGFSSFKKKKAYREKVASLKVVVGRLNEMCLEKPEVLQNKLPEEVMRLFSGIKI